MYICISSNFQLEPPSIAILSRPPTWEEVKSEMPRGPEVDPDLLETPSYRDMSQEEAAGSHGGPQKFPWLSQQKWGKYMILLKNNYMNVVC